MEQDRQAEALCHFLLIYDRSNGVLRHVEEYRHSADALAARFAAERESRDKSIEVVVLGAESLESLKRTHSRYFMAAHAAGSTR